MFCLHLCVGFFTFAGRCSLSFERCSNSAFTERCSNSTTYTHSNSTTPNHSPTPNHTDAVVKAEGARKATLRGVNAKVARKIHTSATFRLPRTLRLPRKPKYVRKAAVAVVPRTDAHSVIKFPLNTESAMRCIENHNTLVFVCDPRANKIQIRKAVETLYGVQVERCNTLIRPDGLKKAFCRLSADADAMETAGKIGFI